MGGSGICSWIICGSILLWVWFLLFLIPVVNFVVAIILAVAVAENFGKGAGFGLGLAFLGFIFYPIVGFGSARYRGARSGLTPSDALRRPLR